jgi:hypothetical protein
MSELLAKSAIKHVSPDQSVSAQQMIWTMLADLFAARRQSLSFPYKKLCPIPTPISVTFHGLLTPFQTSTSAIQLSAFAVLCFVDYKYFFVEYY